MKEGDEGGAEANESHATVVNHGVEVECVSGAHTVVNHGKSEKQRTRLPSGSKRREKHAKMPT